MKFFIKFFRGLTERLVNAAAVFLTVAIVAALGYFLSLFVYAINYLLKSETNDSRINKNRSKHLHHTDFRL